MAGISHSLYVLGCGQKYRGIAGRLSEGASDFSLTRVVQTDTGIHPSSYSMGVEEVKRPEHEADHLHLVAKLRMCGGRGVDEVHVVLTGGLPNVQNTKIYCWFFGTGFRSSLRERSTLYPVTRPGNYYAVGY